MLVIQNALLNTHTFQNQDARYYTDFPPRKTVVFQLKKRKTTPHFFEMGAYVLRSLLSIYASKTKLGVSYSRPVTVMMTVT